MASAASTPPSPQPQQQPIGPSRSKFKLVFLGDATVGKTSILSRFVYGSFGSDYKVTIGIDFVSKTMYLKDRIIRLQCWDTAGGERFRCLVSSYIRDCQVAVVCYDCSNRESFDHVDWWIEDVRAQRRDDVLLVLVANKSDIGRSGNDGGLQRQVSAAEGQAKADRLGATLFMEVSAKDGHNVKSLFEMIAEALPELDQRKIDERQRGRIRLDQKAKGGQSAGGEGGAAGGSASADQQSCCWNL